MENDVQSWLQWLGGQTGPQDLTHLRLVSAACSFCAQLPFPLPSGNFPACVSHCCCFSEPCPPSSVLSSMAEQDVENELLDYEEDEEPQAPPESAPPPPKKDVKGSYVSIHSSGFRDFLLKPELLRAIVDCGFEHPSEGTHPWVLPPSALLSLPRRGPLSHLVRGLHGGTSIRFLIAHVLSSLSPARVYPTSHSGHGRPVPGQVRDGQDSSFCVGHSAAD